MEQIFRKELMDFFHGKTLPFSVDNIICSIVSYALCFFKPSQVIGETTWNNCISRQVTEDNWIFAKKRSSVSSKDVLYSVHGIIMNFIVTRQGLGQARPNKKHFGNARALQKCSPGGTQNFQELKICGHGTVLALYRCAQNVFLTNVSELLRRKNK